MICFNVYVRRIGKEFILIISSVTTFTQQKPNFTSRKTNIVKNSFEKKKQVKREYLARLAEYCDGFCMGKTLPYPIEELKRVTETAKQCGRVDFLNGFNTALKKFHLSD